MNYWATHAIEKQINNNQFQIAPHFWSIANKETLSQKTWAQTDTKARKMYFVSQRDAQVRMTEF